MVRVHVPQQTLKVIGIMISLLELYLLGVIFASFIVGTITSCKWYDKIGETSKDIDRYQNLLLLKAIFIVSLSWIGFLLIIIILVWEEKNLLKN